MSSWIQDLRTALRMLRRNPGFTLIAVATLALGIGANTAIFSMVNAVLIAPLPFREPGRLVMLWNKWEGYKLHHSAMSVPDFLDRRDQSRTLEGAAAFTTGDVYLTGAGEPERLIATRSSASLFEVLGTRPALGRAFRADEDVPGRDAVAVLSHGLWKRRFGGDPAIVGRTIRVDGVPRTVVGVMPRAFVFPSTETQLWLPIAFRPDQMAPTQRGNEWINGVARMKPGIVVAQVRAELDALCARVLGDQLSIFREGGWGSEVSLMREDASAPFRSPLLFLLAAAGLVLLIACSNVAHLMLSRAAARRREIAVRAALGAARGRLARQFLTESLLLALLGGAAGLLLAGWLSDLFAGLRIAGLPRLESFGMDARVFGFAFTLVVLTAALFGFAPLAQLRDLSLAESLKAAGTTTTGGGRRMRAMLVGGEAALTVMLLVAAGLLFRSLFELQSVPPGFEPRGALAARTGLPAAVYPDSASRAAFYERLMERARTLPGIEAVGAVSALPLSGASSTMGFRVAGRAAAPGESRTLAHVRVVAGDYFRAAGIPFMRGSGFSRASPAGVYETIVDEPFVRANFLNEDPIGQRIVFGNDVSVAIVGVVGGIRDAGLGSDSRTMLYLPSSLFPLSTMALVARTGGDPLALAPELRRAVWSLDPNLPVYDVFPLGHVVSESVSSPRTRAFLLALFALLAMALAAVGVYGVVAHAVNRRTREIGLRMAIGARPVEILKLVVGQGMTPVAIGGAAGLAASLILGRLIASQLYGVSPADPWTYLIVPPVLGGVALLACIVPARRATRVDPMTALRAE